MKWAGRANRPEDIAGVVSEAFHQLTSGHPRPVEIEIPEDVLQAKAEVQLPGPTPPQPGQGDPDLLKQAAKLLGQAKQPIIFAGGGVLQAGAATQLVRLAEMLEAPVLASSNGRGILSSRHHLAHGMLAASTLTPKSDVILAIGTRFLTPATAEWKPTAEQTVIQIDADEDEIGRNHRPDLGITADARMALTELLRHVPGANHKRASRKDELLLVQESVRRQLAQYEPQASFGLAIREALPDEAIVVNDLTQVGYWAREGFPVYQPRTFIMPGYQGTLGFGFPTALGAKVGNPDRPVLAICGDGGFMYNVQELATAVQHRINVIAVVFNDQAYGNVRRTQRLDFDGRIIATDLRNPDFVKLAAAFGAEGRRVETSGDLAKDHRRGHGPGRLNADRSASRRDAGHLALAARHDESGLAR